METALFSAEGCGVQPVSSVKDVAAAAFIKSCAAHLKASGKFRLPEWVDYVKTSPAKALAPFDSDWLYIRGAALLRRLFIQPDTGVKNFARSFGSKKRRGVRPGHHVDASKRCIRYCLQQFEKMGLVSQEDAPEGKGGRRLTRKGVSLITQVAKSTHQESRA